MITNNLCRLRGDAGLIGDRSLGNILFRIAGIIGIATHNGYRFGFNFINQDYFQNPLPVCVKDYKRIDLPKNYKGYDFGFMGFNYPDDSNIEGEFGSYLYFQHCEDMVRHYLKIKPLCKPYKDCILMHFRDYKGNTAWHNLTIDYYKKALRKLPKKPVIVVTDNIDLAYKTLGDRFEYTSNTPIMDLYLLSNADYMVMANSTFSWWGAYLSRAVTVAPAKWYAGEFSDAPSEHLYLTNWIRV